MNNKKILAAVLSYNPIPPYSKGVIEINEKHVFVLPQLFPLKIPAAVLATDLQWQELMSHRETLEKVIIFAGKKQSGSLEIISLAVDSFANKKQVLFFLLCDHDLEEKLQLLKSLEIGETQYVTFSDGHTRCYETPFLKGFMYDYADNP